MSGIVRDIRGDGEVPTRVEAPHLGPLHTAQTAQLVTRTFTEPPASPPAAGPDQPTWVHP